MSHKFQNKYRSSSTRLQNWDYRWNAPYFITICTENKEHYFGEIVNGKMILSNQGILADVFWYEIKTHATHVELDEFTVMPNHIHGILILNNPNDGTNVETRHALSLPQTPTPQPVSPPKTPGQQRFQNQGKNSLSSIVGSYKSAVTKHANRLQLYFGWQSRFYENIIRDAEALERIRNYIRNNPSKWKEDKFYR
ncbi:MAG: transposase [Agriterribacter sp.]